MIPVLSLSRMIEFDYTSITLVVKLSDPARNWTALLFQVEVDVVEKAQFKQCFAIAVIGSKSRNGLTAHIVAF